jgi:hypothetical protein
MLHACLYNICFVFFYTSWRFYAFSRTSLLTRCHSASSYFLLFLCFRKVTQEIFSELGETKTEVPNYLTRRRSPKESRRQTKGQPHQVVAWATPWPRYQVVWPPGPPPDIALPPINSLWRENPKGPITFPRNILQTTAVVDARLRGSRSSSRYPARDGNYHRGPSSSPCLPSDWCVSSLLIRPNVSIIFDAPCLFIHHLLYVLLYFVAFLCIFRN